MTDCYLAAGVLHTARVEVTNTADEAAGFRMRVRFESPDGKTVYGRSPSLDVDSVDAGETTRPYRFVIETEGEDPSKTMECKPEVTRLPA